MYTGAMELFLTYRIVSLGWDAGWAVAREKACYFESTLHQGL